MIFLHGRIILKFMQYSEAIDSRRDVYIPSGNYSFQSEKTTMGSSTNACDGLNNNRVMKPMRILILSIVCVDIFMNPLKQSFHVKFQKTQDWTLINAYIDVEYNFNKPSCYLFYL
jgi:hypothetical protein